jgi:hypothetical protein
MRVGRKNNGTFGLQKTHYEEIKCCELELLFLVHESYLMKAADLIFNFFEN